MNLIPFKKRDLWFDAFDDFDNLGAEINKFLTPMSKCKGRDGLFRNGWAPSVDVYESDSDILIKVDMPGLNKDEIDVSIHDNVLTVKGEKKMENEVKKENYYRAERAYGSFSRSIELPSEVEADKVTAVYKNGVLDLKLGKKEEAKTKRISIDVK